MAIETFQRQEIKFLLNEVQYQALTEQLEQYMNPDPYCVGGKDYGIYNIYYDTPDDYLIRTSLAKPYYKEKIRHCSANFDFHQVTVFRYQQRTKVPA